MSAWEQLADFEQRVGEARAREQEVTVERNRARGEATVAAAERDDWHEQVGAGEADFDAERAGALRVAAASAADAASEDVWAQRAAGARRAREAAEQLRDGFGRTSFEALAADLIERAPAVRDRMAAAYDELLAAEQAYVGYCARWSKIAAAGGLPAESLPYNPMTVANEAERRRRIAALPVPVEPEQPQPERVEQPWEDELAGRVAGTTLGREFTRGGR